MAQATVTFTHGHSTKMVAYYTDGEVIGVPGSMEYDDSQIWTVEKIEADLIKSNPGKTIVILSID